MLHALCLNPAVDRVYRIGRFTAGGAYHDNQPTVSAGGKGVNVARAAATLGAAVTLRGFAGGDTGDIIRRAAADAGIPADWTEPLGDTRMTINILDTETSQETEIKERGPSADGALTAQFMQRLRDALQPDDIVIASGAALPGMPADIYRRVADLCAGAGALCYLDVKGAELAAALGDGSGVPFALAKPNQYELAELFGASPDETDLLPLARRLRARGVETVLLTLGRGGALLLSPEGEYRAEIPAVTVRQTIGCGDSAVAGYAMARARGERAADALRYAMACAVANATGRFIGDVTPGAVRRLAGEIQVAEM